MRNEIIAKRFDQERALYNLKHTDVLDCVFAGPAGGESALKDARDVRMENCCFSLGYPLWHAEKFHLHDSRMDEHTRSPMWYCRSGLITDSDIHGSKAIRECRDIDIRDCTVTSEEFGWKSSNITVTDSTLSARHLFLDSRNITLDRVKMSGEYSFQYMEGITIRNSVLDTKEAFWHSKNVTVENSVIKGDCLGWFSQGMTLRHCRIIGARPLCYCKDLTLEDCTMEDGSSVSSEARTGLVGHVDSVRNIHSGRIIANSKGRVITAGAAMRYAGTVTVR